MSEKFYRLQKEIHDTAIKKIKYLLKLKKEI